MMMNAVGNSPLQISNSIKLALRKIVMHEPELSPSFQEIEKQSKSLTSEQASCKESLSNSSSHGKENYSIGDISLVKSYRKNWKKKFESNGFGKAIKRLEQEKIINDKEIHAETPMKIRRDQFFQLMNKSVVIQDHKCRNDARTIDYYSTDLTKSMRFYYNYSDRSLDIEMEDEYDENILPEVFSDGNFILVDGLILFNDEELVREFDMSCGAVSNRLNIKTSRAA